MQDPDNKRQPDVFFEICRRNSLRITPQRTAIYQAVVQSENHPSADDIFRIVQKKFPAISFDTVNRTLLTFTQIGLLTITESYRGARRFDPNTADHHHLHCMECGRIVDFTSDEFDHLTIPDKMKREFASVHSIRVVMNGICSDCNRGG